MSAKEGRFGQRWWRRAIGGIAVGAALVTGAAARPVEGSPLAEAVETARAAGVNRLEILDGGYDALLLRVHLIRQARSSVSIQTFIWTNDECGRLLICELIAAARRGVNVRIIADSMFSDQEADVVAFLATADPHFEVRHYRPAASRLKPGMVDTLLTAAGSFHDLNQRMHSKVMIVDDAVLVTGGRNVENTYFDHSTGMNFRDRDVLAVGPVVAAAVAEFEQFWNYPCTVRSLDLADVAGAVKGGAFKRYPERGDYDFGTFFGAMEREADDATLIETRFAARLRPVGGARFLHDAPGKVAGDDPETARITRDLTATLERARESVLIQTPYLVLSRPARDLFREMRARTPGLRIRVSTNSFASTDNLFAYSANYRLRADYVQDLHLEIHEFKPLPGELRTLFPRYDELVEVARRKAGTGRKGPPPYLALHAKSLVIDDRIAFVGSYNLDPRSENLNTEVGLLVEDEAFARELREKIERDLRPENSWVVARLRLPLRLDVVNRLVDGVLSASPVDVWPIQNFELFRVAPGTAGSAAGASGVLPELPRRGVVSGSGAVADEEGNHHASFQGGGHAANTGPVVGFW